MTFEIWLAFAAETTPPSCSVLTPWMPAKDASKRMPSSIACGSLPASPLAGRAAIGTISASKARAPTAAIARWWLCSA